MNIRIVELPAVSPLRSQAVYHGLANCISDNDEPVLLLIRPTSAYISVGLHQDIKLELNWNWCNKNLPIIRRNIGGGTVLLDSNQLFFQFIFPKKKIPSRPNLLYQLLLKPVIHCYEQLGLKQVTQTGNDIHIDGKKICGTGAANIGDATVLVGSFLFDFDFELMAKSISSPSENYSQIFCKLMRQKMTTINAVFEIAPGEFEIIQLLKKNIQLDLGYNPVSSTFTEKELDYIERAEQELQSDDWTFQSGNRLIKNGIKIAANSYLLEKNYPGKNNDFVLRLFLSNDLIKKIWIEPDCSSNQIILNQINLSGKSHIDCLQLFNHDKYITNALQDLLDFTPY